MIHLRPYQTKAIQEVRELIRSGVKRILINAPTGAGKTVIGASILHGAHQKASPTLFLAHRRELIQQSAAKIHDAGISDYGIIMAGDKRNNTSALVQVASIQTLLRREFPDAKIVIIDEAHRAAAKSYRDLVANYPDAVVLGLSATPERQDGKGLDDLFEAMVTVSTIPALIDEGYLMAPKCYVGMASADLSAVSVRGGDYVESQLQEAMDKSALIGDILTEWRRHAAGRRTVVFASGVNHSKHIAEAFWAAGIPAAHIDGDTPTAERDAILADWRRGAIKVVTNCMILTEGFDFPELEVAILARATKSVGLYLQMVGRIMRTSPGKDQPLLLDHAGCVMTHGAPSIHREWSLQGEKERRKRRDIPELFQCRECQMIFHPETTFYLDGDTSKKLVKCPGCGTAGCPSCAALFPFKVDRRVIEGEFEELSVACPQCAARFVEKAAHAVPKPSEDTIPGSVDGSMVEFDPSTIPLPVQVKNDFRRLMKLAREKGWKRGKVWHELANQYDSATLREALPRHTANWWRGQA